MAYWRDFTRKSCLRRSGIPPVRYVVIDAPADDVAVVTQQLASGWSVDVDGVQPPSATEFSRGPGDTRASRSVALSSASVHDRNRLHADLDCPLAPFRKVCKRSGGKHFSGAFA
jgi:hypothetical protein